MIATNSITQKLEMKLDCIRLRVRRLKPAIRFYSALFGWPVVQELYNGEIYVFHMTDGRKLQLDDIRQVHVHVPQARPVAVLTVSDLASAQERTRLIKFHSVSEKEPGIHFPNFVCRDLDQNEFIVAERPFPYPGTEGMPNRGPIQPFLSGITVQVSDIQGAVELYTAWLGAPLAASKGLEGSQRLLLQDRSWLELCPQADPAARDSFPLLRMQTVDAPAAYRHLKEIGATLLTRQDEGTQGHPIRFKDPDGNLLLVESVGAIPRIPI
jgi:catechol 2,3-dioxygenase-like lactoylglutathione lyase family enzyme